MNLGRYSGQPQFDRRLMCRQSFLPAALLAIHAPQAVKNGRVLRMGLNGMFQRCQGFARQTGGRIRVAKLDPIPLEARNVRATGKGKRPLEQFRLVVRPALQIAENLLGGGEPHVELYDASLLIDQERSGNRQLARLVKDVTDQQIERSH